VGRIVRIALIALVGAAVIGCAALEGAIILGAHTEIRAQPQVIVVLGAQVKGTDPSVLLRDRLDAALTAMEDYPEAMVVVSGGQGRDEGATEASVMRDYLVSRGADSGRIWLEDASHNTAENLRNTAALLKQRDYDLEETHLLVVSNGFHLFRARMLSARFGLDASTMAAPASDRLAGAIAAVREIPGAIKSFLLDR